MGLTVLVVGARGEDSGKTVAAASLVSALRVEGYRAAGFKPYAAGRLWGSPGIYRETVSRHLLVGMDALMLWESMDQELSLEHVNPGALVLGEFDVARNRWRGPALMGVDEMSRIGVLGRISSCQGSRVETLHFINIEALKRLPSGLEEAFTDMAVAVKPYPLKVGDEFVSRFVRGEYEDQILSCYGRLLEGYEVVVVESNHDVAVPLRKGLYPGLVVAVAPGRIGVVDGDRYVKALGLLGGSGVVPNASEVVSLAGTIFDLGLPYLEDPYRGYGIDILSPVIEQIAKLLRQ